MFSDKASARKLKRWAIIAAIAVGSVIATLLLGNVSFFQSLHTKAGDLHFLIRKNKPTPNIVLITSDKKTLDTFPELRYFWHPYYAQAIHAAAEGGAKVFGLDVAWGVPVTKWEPDNDGILAEAVISTAATMPVICVYATSMNSRQKAWPIPINMVAAAFDQNAYANLNGDSDDFIRTQELVDKPEPDGQFNRGLAFRLAEKFRGVDGKVEDGQLTWAGRAIPTVRPRTIIINYAGPPGTFQRVPLCDFIAAARAGRKDQIRQWVGGKAVLLGADNDLEDRDPTPYFTAFSGPNHNTAGVEIQANTLRTLLDGDYLMPVSQPVRVAALTVVAGVTAIVSATLAAAPAAYLLIAGIAAIVGITHLMFVEGLILSSSELALACLISVLASIVYRFLTAEKRGAFFQSVTKMFVGKTFAERISEDQEISLHGSSQLVTILFSDIRGFTAFCDGKDPSVVVDLLNEYMGGMVKIIVKYHGNVNKFIGDGILAIFSDEDGTAPGDHALRAVRCGTEMAQVEEHVEGGFKTGVGIHSGMAVVGNVGSPDKMEYTVLGDTVNIASRLESLNKEMKTRLILSEDTRELLHGQFETVSLGELKIRGREVPLGVYTAAALREAKPAPKPEPETMAEKS